MLEGSEVTLSVRVVVLGESVEGFHFLTDRGLIFRGQGSDAAGLDCAAGDTHSLAATVIEA
jgi:hypothetical protein